MWSVCGGFASFSVFIPWYLLPSGVYAGYVRHVSIIMLLLTRTELTHAPPILSTHVPEYRVTKMSGDPFLDYLFKGRSSIVLKINSVM